MAGRKGKNYAIEIKLKQHRFEEGQAHETYDWGRRWTQRSS